MKLWKRSIKIQFILIVTLLVILSGTLAGVITYQTAKKELKESGLQQLQEIVAGAIAVSATLQDEVIAGNLTLKEAQDKAKDIIDGPMNPDGKSRDLTKAHFMYKTEGYMWASDNDITLTMHPLGFENVSLKDYQLDNGVYLTAELVRRGKLPNAEDRTLVYPWKNAGRMLMKL
ncbi:hypothetical protein EHS13_27995 [Paenibacillus psychroresistens]|uniref:Single Cache domain-containing protein n=1 Tax=Paenibacillus psychroresistens TaxID=1778678 RepID=A0A6B8RR50_9BACL|nr:cache domain-containing protein [Paenibacillus psychroresistens]QGQ98449.1 hypothetical protein EHS13_27995 [Paenibacillus psychroresistens]